MRDLSTRHVNLKVEFDDMDDLKQKIDSTVLIEKVPKTETITILNSEGEVSICNTSIRKVKRSMSPVPEMEVIYKLKSWWAIQQEQLLLLFNNRQFILLVYLHQKTAVVAKIFVATMSLTYLNINMFSLFIVSNKMCIC